MLAKLNTSCRRVLSILKYALKTRLLFFIIIPIFLIAALTDYLSSHWTRLSELTTTWNDFISPLIGITTLFIALSVWLSELAQDWRNNLSKKLTVIFHYDDKEVMRCNRAELSSEADIRQLGQQIGSQMTGVKLLKFIAPLVRQVKNEISFVEDIGFFIVYEVIFELTELPSDLNPNKCLLWEPPFSEKPKEVSQPEL